ncbi:MAG: type II toxin-antitoxin system PemK/MazF family toxin [Chitinophagaceae bacterium]
MVRKTIRQFEVYYVDLNPAVGAEIQKTRPCIVVSPTEVNNFLDTVIVVPLTSTIRNYPTRVPLTVKGKKGQAACDQIRSVSIDRLGSFAEKVSDDAGNSVLTTIIALFKFIP